MAGNEAQRDPVCTAHAAALHHALSGSEPDLYAIGSECGAFAAPLPWDPWGGARAEADRARPEGGGRAAALR
eukprot:7054534-Prymnesium_polylepis.1